jgi:hypothetical protein
MQDHDITTQWRECVAEIQARRRARMARELGIIALTLATIAAAAAWIVYHA